MSVQTVLTLTANPSLDIWTTADQFVQGQKTRCSPAQMYPGGGGINVARALKRLGCEASAVFLSGGPIGSVIEDRLDKEGVTFKAFPVPLNSRISFACHETKGQKNFHFVTAGSDLEGVNLRGFSDWLEKELPVFDWVIASGSLPSGFDPQWYAHVGAMLASFPAQFVLDTSGEALTGALQSAHPIDYLRVNQRELLEVMPIFFERGQETIDESNLASYEKEFIDRSPVKNLIYTKGAKGAVFVNEGHRFEVSPPDGISVVSEVGAGDSFVAGFVSGLMSAPNDFDKALISGVAAAASAVQTQGTELLEPDSYRKIMSDTNAAS